MKRMSEAADSEGGVRFLFWVVGGLIVVGFFIFLALGANGPKDPKLAPRQQVAGFGTAGFSVEHGAVTDDFCALLAATDSARETGMMGRRDFAGYDAMVFAWPQPLEPNQIAFYNRKVPIALTVAWFEPGGKFVSSSDMEPCEDRPDCPLFRAGTPWQFAVEVAKGGLGRLGIGPGSVFKLKSTC